MNIEWRLTSVTSSISNVIASFSRVLRKLAARRWNVTWFSSRIWITSWWYHVTSENTHETSLVRLRCPSDVCYWSGAEGSGPSPSLGTSRRAVSRPVSQRRGPVVAAAGTAAVAAAAAAARMSSELRCSPIQYSSDNTRQRGVC